MTPYLDTSVVVAAISGETRTDDMQAWLQANADNVLLVSHWGAAEVSAALSIKRRIGNLSPRRHADVLATFHRLSGAVFDMVEVTAVDFTKAAQFADSHDAGLRAGDALHLAIASRHGAILHTLDRRLAAAGERLGIAATLL